MINVNLGLPAQIIYLDYRSGRFLLQSPLIGRIQPGYAVSGEWPGKGSFDGIGRILILAGQWQCTGLDIRETG
jgi:hypothetical protein